MDDVFFDKVSDIPKNYFFKSSTLEKESVNYKGREYTAVGSYEIEYPFLSRIWLISSSLFKLIVSISLLRLILQNALEAVQTGLTGKKIVKVYCVPDALNSPEAKAHAIGSKMKDNSGYEKIVNDKLDIPSQEQPASPSSSAKKADPVDATEIQPGKSTEIKADAIESKTKDNVSWYEKIVKGELDVPPEQPPASPSSSAKKADPVDATEIQSEKRSEIKKPRVFTPVNLSDLEKEMESLRKESKDKIKDLEQGIETLENLGKLREDLGKLRTLKADKAALLRQKKAALLSAHQEQILIEKKTALLAQGLELFKKHKCQTELETYRLSHSDKFKLGYDQSQSRYTDVPSYFNETFQSKNHLDLTSTPNFFDYHSTDPTIEDFWLDFANAHLGGGCFSPHGFVQEEIMVHEIIELAAYIAGHLNSHHWCEILTREGGKDKNRVMQGSPTPLLFKGLHRVQAVDNDVAYGRKIQGISKEKLLSTTQSLPIPQKVNIVAGAAPKLYSTNREEQWHPHTLEDDFNTLMAVFTLLQEQSENPFLHSGKLGCGAFNNDVHALYLLHCLAAQHKGMRVKLHGYSDMEAEKYKASWNAIVPELADKSLKECIAMISQHLHQQEAYL